MPKPNDPCKCLCRFWRPQKTIFRPGTDVLAWGVGLSGRANSMGFVSAATCFSAPPCRVLLQAFSARQTMTMQGNGCRLQAPSTNQEVLASVKGRFAQALSAYHLLPSHCGPQQPPFALRGGYLLRDAQTKGMLIIDPYSNDCRKPGTHPATRTTS